MSLNAFLGIWFLASSIALVWGADAAWRRDNLPDDNQHKDMN